MTNQQMSPRVYLLHYTRQHSHHQSPYQITLQLVQPIMLSVAGSLLPVTQQPQPLLGDVGLLSVEPNQ